MSSLTDEKLNDILEEALNDHFKKGQNNEQEINEEINNDKIEIDNDKSTNNEEEVNSDQSTDNEEDNEEENVLSFKNIDDFISSGIKWIFLSGKGGVGKTTCSSSVGIKCSQKLLTENKKVLIVSTDPAHNLSDSFNQKFNETPKLVESFENLYCMEYDNKIGIKKHNKNL